MIEMTKWEKEFFIDFVKGSNPTHMADVTSKLVDLLGTAVGTLLTATNSQSAENITEAVEHISNDLTSRLHYLAEIKDEVVAEAEARSAGKVH